MIADDISTLPLHVFELMDDGAKRRLRRAQRGVGIDPYKLRWQPNAWQTGKEFWGLMGGHLLLRGNGYAEIIEGRSGFADQLIPRHPDRMQVKMLPSGRLQYTHHTAFGEPRTLSQDQVFHLRDLSQDGILGMSRVSYGLQSMGAALAQEYYTQRFFKQGATAALALVNKGADELSEEQEADLHQSISRYMSGSENAGGFLLLDANMEVAKLGIEPEKAQLLLSREFTIREVARWFKMPAHKLQAAMQTESYNSVEVKELSYVIGTIRPLAIGIEQSVQRDLILQKDAYFVEFLLDALLRGDTKARADYYKAAIQFGWMNRNEVRLRENMNPAEGLDRFLEPENMRDADPDMAAERENDRERRRAQADIAHNRRVNGADATITVRAALLAYEAGQRVVRKEKAAVSKAAEKYANDGAGWSTWLREFYADHADFVSSTLHVPMAEAREYAAEHGTLLESVGVKAMEDWDHVMSAELARWALEGNRAA